MAVIWCTFKEFEAAWVGRYPNADSVTRMRYGIEVRLQIDLRIELLKKSIPFPVDPEPEGIDEPGPVDCWYGTADDFFFLITYHRVALYATISTRPSLPELDHWKWSLLLRLTALPDPLLRRVTWIQSHTEGATHAVYYRKPSGDFAEVYRALNEAEASSLIAFLNSNGTDLEYALEAIRA